MHYSHNEGVLQVRILSFDLTFSFGHNYFCSHKKKGDYSPPLGENHPFFSHHQIPTFFIQPPFSLLVAGIVLF